METVEEDFFRWCSLPFSSVNLSTEDSISDRTRRIFRRRPPPGDFVVVAADESWVESFVTNRVSKEKNNVVEGTGMKKEGSPSFIKPCMFFLRDDFSLVQQHTYKDISSTNKERSQK